MYESILLLIILGLSIKICLLKGELERARENAGRPYGGYSRLDRPYSPSGSASLGAE
jgi:hypothetical protein